VNLCANRSNQCGNESLVKIVCLRPSKNRIEAKLKGSQGWFLPA
jgi:hypothetical protein